MGDRILHEYPYQRVTKYGCDVTRRAKIVSTIGPACSSTEQIHALVEAGIDVARLNMSHGEHAVHEEVYHRIRAAADATGRGVGILADLQGPKIRIGRFPDGPVRLTLGDEFTITTEDVPGTRREVSTTYQGLPGDVGPGDTVLIDDGRVALEVTAVDGPRVRTVVKVGSGRKILDQAAQRAVQRWLFSPAKRGDEVVDGWVDVPIDFKLST